MRKLAEETDLILVIGSRNSSNSNRLRDLGEELGIPSHLIDDETHIRPEWLDGRRTVGVTAGASAPQVLIDRVLHALAQLRPCTVILQNGTPESVRFKLPPEVTDAARFYKV